MRKQKVAKTFRFYGIAESLGKLGFKGRKQNKFFLDTSATLSPQHNERDKNSHCVRDYF